MKNLILYIFSTLIIIGLGCREKLLDIAPTPIPEVKTLAILDSSRFDTEGILLVSGEATAVGDGLREHGFVFGTISDPRISNTNPSFTDLGERDVPGSFQASITFDIPDNTETFYIRTYARDKYRQEYHGNVIPVVLKVVEVTADFSMSTDNCPAVCEVQFQNLSINAESYVWDFGDGSPISEEASPKHSYLNPGTFQVKLKALRPGSKPDSTSKTVTVQQVKFDKSFPGMGQGYKVLERSQGGYFIVGTVQDFSSPPHVLTDISFIRTNSEGQADIQKKISVGDFDEARDMVQFPDGSIGIIGYTVDIGELERDIIYLQIDTLGQPLIPSQRVSTPNYDDQANGLVQTSDKQVWIAGFSTPVGSPGDSSALLMRAARDFSSGLPIQRIDNPANNVLNAITLNPPAEYFAVGSSEQHGKLDVLIHKFRNDGTPFPSFPKTISGLEREEGYAIDINGRDEIAICGLSVSSNGNGDIYLAKTNKNGEVLSPYPITLGGANFESANGVVHHDNGDVVIVGQNNQDGFILYLKDQQKIASWKKTVNLGGFTKLNSVSQTRDGGYIATGLSGSSLILIKTDKNGNFN